MSSENGSDEQKQDKKKGEEVSEVEEVRPFERSEGKADGRSDEKVDEKVEEVDEKVEEVDETDDGADEDTRVEGLGPEAVHESEGAEEAEGEEDGSLEQGQSSGRVDELSEEPGQTKQPFIEEGATGLLDDIEISKPPDEYAGISVVSPVAEVEMNLPVQETKKEEGEKVSPHFIEEPVFEKTIFAIKTAIGHEKMVANRIAGRARKRKARIYSILAPTKLRGYLLIEGEKNIEAIQDLLRGVQHAHSVIGGEADLGEIEHFLTPKPLVSGIAEGDIVEIVSGPFKGEKARVQQIDESKEEITMELFDALVSIPVTIRGDAVRVLEKDKED